MHNAIFIIVSENLIKSNFNYRQINMLVQCINVRVYINI